MNHKYWHLFIIMTTLLGGCSLKHSNYAVYHKSEDMHLTEAHIEVLSSDDFKPLFHGKVSGSNTLDTAPVMYSGAAGIIGFVAQIAAHSAAVGGARSSKLTEEQKAANEVLNNYSGLNDFSVRSLLNDHNRFVPVDSPESGVRDHYIKVSPLFYISQDRILIELHAVVEAYHKSQQDDALYSNVIKIYAKRDMLEDAEISLLAPALYNAAISYAVKDMESSLSEVDLRNKSYDLSGGFERGKKLSSSCDHQVIRNLRGWIVADFPLELVSDCQVLPSQP